MNRNKGFASPATIGIVAFVVVVVIMFGYYFVPKKDSAVSDVVQNESATVQAAKQCKSDNDCGTNSYCGWGGKCIPGNSATDKTSQSGSTNPTENNSTQTSISSLSPANNAEFTIEDAMKAITFRWTPVVPKPQEPVTYRLRVWQLMQGQNSTDAMKTNQPIITKDVDNITEASVSGIYTGPCRPPYLCDYVWKVEVKGNRESARPSVIDVSVSSAFSIKEPAVTDGGTSAGTSSGTQ